MNKLPKTHKHKKYKLKTKQDIKRARPTGLAQNQNKHNHNKPQNINTKKNILNKPIIKNLMLTSHSINLPNNKKNATHTNNNKTVTKQILQKIHIYEARPNSLAPYQTKQTYNKHSKYNPKINKIKRQNSVHKKQQHSKPTTSQAFSLRSILLLSGDIETNPGPMPNILQTHPSTHKNRCKMYFIECTIKLLPEYQHLATQFSPILNLAHPKHQDTIIDYPHLSKYIYNNLHHPPPRILYALITTISPVIETCNHLLTQTPTPDWTTIILEKMATLQNPPERHIITTHPYTQFINTNQNIINPSNTIHKELYNFIRQTNGPLNIQLITNQFPFLPEKLLTEALKYKEPLHEYSHPPLLPTLPTPRPQENQITNPNTHLIT